ncbi:MAG: hypothetical protein IT463_08260 [Planctomycetes bacterium]|nr:hypothetical protein [Planctomycetota bacterium]
MAGPLAYVFPTSNALAQAALSPGVPESRVSQPAPQGRAVDQSAAGNADRDADGRYFGPGAAPEEPPAERIIEGVFARGRDQEHSRQGHTLERLGGLGAVVDSEY